MPVAGVVLAALAASPALAQSLDPDRGTSNIVRRHDSTTYTRGSAARRHRTFGRVVPGGAPSPAPFAGTPAFGQRWPGAKYDANGYYIDPNSPGRW